MRACEVMKLLRISRQTLSNYTKKGLIRTTTLVNGRYDYNTDDVYKLLNNDVERKTCIYARVSTVKQKKDLENQVDILKQFCFMNGYKINEVYTDVASGISFEKRKDFFKIIYVFLTIFLYLLKCPQSLILSALRAFCFCGKPHISRSIFLYFLYQTWLKSW